MPWRLATRSSQTRFAGWLCQGLGGTQRRHPMSSRSVVIALASLAAIACGGSELLSPPSTWGGDFTDRSPPTDECPGGTLAQLRTRMGVSEPYTLLDSPFSVPDTVESKISDKDRLYSFWFSTDPQQPNYWGFGGYLVARQNCIIYVELTEHDN